MLSPTCVIRVTPLKHFTQALALALALAPASAALAEDAAGTPGAETGRVVAAEALSAAASRARQAAEEHTASRDERRGGDEASSADAPADESPAGGEPGEAPSPTGASDPEVPEDIGEGAAEDPADEGEVVEEDHGRVPPRPEELVAQEEAVDLALRCACHTHPQKQHCRDQKREHVARIVADLLWVVDQRADQVPDEYRPILVAVACGESGFENRPDCGGRPGCNDHGTSAGMFQYKRKGALARRYQELHGEPLDLHDHMEAGLYYVDRLLVGVHDLVPSACGRMPRRDRWNVAAYRLGRGPVVEPARPEQTLCAPTPVSIGSEREACFTRPARPAVQRCNPGSKYARWSTKWYREAPRAWTLVPAVEDGQGDPGEL